MTATRAPGIQPVDIDVEFPNWPKAGAGPTNASYRPGQADTGNGGSGSQIDLMLEAEKRGILPDAKKPLLAEARRRGLVPQGDSEQGAGEHYMRLVNAYIPGSARIRAAAGAAADYFGGPEDDRRGFGERYDERLKREWARDDEAQKDDSAAGIGARTAGLAATTVMTGGGNLVRSGLAQAGATVPQLMKESARIGAGIGAPTALANTRESDPVNQAGDVIEGTIGGGALGSAVPAAGAMLRGVGRFAKLPFTGVGGSRLPAQQQAAADMRATLHPDVDVPGAAIAESPSLQRTGRGLAGNIIGGPVRDDVAPAIDSVGRRIREELRGPSGGPGPAQFGEETQGFLRRNLREHSRSGAQLDAMTPAELEQVRGTPVLGRNPEETYPTQFGARYREAEQTPAPQHGTVGEIRANFLDPRPPGQAGPTATWNLLDDLGQQARAAGQLKGWRDRDFSSPQFWGMLDKTLGTDVTGLLRSEFDRAASRQANLGIPGLRDQRTMVRRAIEDARSGNPAASATGDIAALERLHGAMSDDLQRFMNANGATEGALKYLFTDHAYRTFITEQREPLRKLFGQNVSPDQAFNQLYRATQSDTQNIQLLRAYYRTLDEKGRPGDVLRATRTLLSPAAEGGLNGFLDAYRNLAPEARQIMFGRGQTAQLGQNLDRLARVAERLRPYEQASQGGRFGVDLSRPSNVAMVASMFFHIPSALSAAGGGHLLARFMASPRYVRWLTEMPNRAAHGINSPAFQAHMARLNTLGADDKELGKAVLDAVGDVLRPANAAQK